MNTNDISEGAAIDRKLGLSRYEGDEKIYANVLKNFERNNKNKIKELNGALDMGSIKLAHRITHSLRGAAGTIGATRLSDAALHVECFLTDEAKGVLVEPLKKQMAVLESAYTAVFDELGPLSAEKETDCGLCAMNREKTLELIRKLTPFLEAGDAATLEYLDEINESFLSAAEGFKLFISQMESYDFEQALETMNDIRQFMGT